MVSVKVAEPEFEGQTKTRLGKEENDVGLMDIRVFKVVVVCGRVKRQLPIPLQTHFS